MALFHPLFTLGTLTTATIFLDLKTCFAEDDWPRAKNPLTFINFSLRLWAQIKHVFLIEFTQAVWLLTNWWLGMNETNLTQHGRSTDVNASHVLYLRDKKKTLKKRGNLLRNGFLLRQFMSWKNINQNNYSLCKSSSDHKSAGIWI